jgi:signal transduction histidine kinase
MGSVSKRTQGRKIYVGTTFEINNHPGFVVADNGAGFQDPADYLTMPFFTRKPDGMGLGLHIADEIMKLHGGRLVFPETGELRIPKGHNGAIAVLQFGDK